ncbi:MAG: PD-(D/E)XK nuclease-like domain-containing protein [Planctomycetes bacterium]|nr:PD-(D/E)XK nuclease-like domain-containing protein [Planctomycetota bacterium]
MAEPRVRTLPPQPGLHPGIPFEAYILWAALSQTDLKAARTMRHLRHRLDTVPERPGPAQCKGTAFHTILLEPATWRERIAACPINPKSGESWGRGTRAWDDFEAANPGKTYVSSAELADVHAMALAARNNETVKMIRASTKIVEASAVWIDPDFHVQCKGRFDCLIELPDRVIVADFKSTLDASPEKFGRDAEKYGYHFQMAFYERACRALFPGKKFVPYLIACESEAPYCVASYPVEPETLAVGESQVRTKLWQYAKAVKENEWPGYEAETPLVLPAWAYRQIENEVEDVN